MELIEFLKKINNELIVVLITLCVAFISYIIKGLIEKPLNESKQTFGKYSEKRIEILSEIKARLHLIAYFPSKEESEDFKLQLQSILLRDGKPGYLNKVTFEDTLKISITPDTDEKLLLQTITQIDDDLYKLVAKVKDEVKFYNKFSNYNPIKRFVGFLILILLYIISLALIFSIIGSLIYAIIYCGWILKIIIVLFVFIMLYFMYKWIS